MMQGAVARREINALLHFTKLDNLEKILNNGIIPRKTLEDAGQEFSFNDNYRLDGYKNASCMSLGHPNYKMFYKLRVDNPREEWVVIGCRPSVLWEKECAFCYENAASASITALPLASKLGVAAFEHLFSECAGKPDRRTLGLQNSCPTNPQAEVLVFGTVEPQYIFGAVFQSPARAAEFTGKYPALQFLYNANFFKARRDHLHWK